MQPNKDFNYDKAYSKPANVDIKSQESTNYSDRYDVHFDSELGDSCFIVHNYEVGSFSEEGI